MIKVQCPDCGEFREVGIWKKSWGGPPYVKKCPVCSKLGRSQSAESKEKKSKALKGKKKPIEYSERLKQRHVEDPTLKQNLIPGAGGGWNKYMELPPRSEETKQKISKSMQQRGKEEE